MGDCFFDPPYTVFHPWLGMPVLTPTR